MISRSESPERRSHPRASLLRPAVVFVGDKRLPAQTIDVSESGIGVALSGEGAAGTFVRVNFNVDEGRPGAAPWLDVDGVVVRTHAHAGRWVWGIRFLSAPASVVAGIKSHVAGGARPGASTVGTAATAGRIPSPPPAIPKAPSSTAIPRASSSTSIPAAADRPRPAASIPSAAAPPRVASRQAHDLRALYRSALEQVQAERRRAKKK